VTVSIVIATRNREHLLDDCLEHLARQAFLPGDDVIVVDNASSDGTAAAIAGHARAFPVPLQYLLEPQCGKSYALRRALAVAHGDIIAFTDDDVNVTPQWLAEIRRAMADERIALVGGPVAPRWERHPPRWLPPEAVRGRLAAPIALLDYGRDAAPLGPRTAIGANLAVRRAVLERLGGFRTEVGKLEGTLLSGEDADLCRRVSAAGLLAVYLPTAQVRHWVPAARLRLRYFLSWFFWSGVSYAVLDEDGPPPRRSIGSVPLYIVRRFATGLVESAAAAATGRPAAAVDKGTDAAFAAGYALRRWCLVGPARTRPSVPAEGRP
jgi:glucosyl-dolichyl phosphate glucuronosyltransferase